MLLLLLLFDFFFFFYSFLLCSCSLPNPFPERVVRLLEQYQNRLHGSTDNYEELDYIKQILASSLFQQYRDAGGVATSLPPQHSSELVQAVNLLETNNVDEAHISPAEKRKRNIHRKESLKALRNVVVSKKTTSSSSLERGSPGVGGVAHKSSPIETPSRNSPLKGPATSQLRQLPEPLPLATRDVSSFSEQTGQGHMTATIPMTRPMNSSLDTPPSLDAAAPTSVYPLPEDNPFSGATKTTTAFVRHHADTSKSSSLSNSSSLMLEAGFPPSGGSGDMMRGFEGMGSGMGISRARHKSSITGSQPNISRLRITQQGGLEFDDPDDPTPDAMAGEDPLEWVEPKLTLSPISPPTASRPPPPSYITHMAQNHTPNPVSTLDHDTSRVPAIYGMDARRRAKSYEKLLEATDGYSPYPNQPLAPLVKPMTDGVTTKDILTTERRRTSLVVRLNKGKTGLGFRLKGLKKEQVGGLYIQDMQLDGPAAR